MTFIDLEKECDRVPKKLIWRTLRNKYVPNDNVEIVQDMYKGAITNVRTVCRKGVEFLVGVGLHQGSALSS